VDKIKALLDELAAVVAEMEAMTEDAPEGEAPAEPMSEEQEASLRSLETKADKLRERIEFLQRVQANELELRAVLERGAPAKRVEKTETPEEAPAVESRAKVYAVPKSHRPLKGFRCEERAYRAGMSIKATLLGDAEARRWCEDHGVESRAQAGGINALGGVLTNPELSSEIIRLVEEFGAFPANARRVGMNSDTLLIARRVGGLTARPIGENAAPATSDATFDNVQLVAKLWGVDNRIPMSLMEDSVIDLADAMAVEGAQAFSEAYDRVGFIGTGSGADHGTTGVAVAIIDGTHTASVVTAATGNNAFGDTGSGNGLDLSDFTNVVARLPLFARNRSAKWYISPAGYGSSMLRLLMQAGGNNGADVAGGAGLQFLGYPVVLCHPLESGLGNNSGKVACLFGDLGQAATFATRREVSVKTDASRFIEFDQLLTFATSRVAVVAHDLGDNVKAGPVVALRFA
jgi:HK97 family phage major capsid protein